MQAGKLRHRITLQRQQQARDPDTGAVITAWVDHATVWAQVTSLSARDLIAAQAQHSQVVARIVIRWRQDVSHGMRCLHDGRIYTIEGVLPDPHSGREYLTLPVSEGVTAP